MKCLILLIAAAVVLASEHNRENDEEIFDQDAYAPILVKIEEDEYSKAKNISSKYIGVWYNKTRERWMAYRRRKIGKKMFYNGSYSDEETAAHASDTLARKLMANGENFGLNFPDDGTEVYAENTNTSKFIGVSYKENHAKWRAYRRSKNESKMVYNGCYKDEETAAHASDTLARKLMENGEQNHILNFPDDGTEVYPEKRKTTSTFIGVSYNKKDERWSAQRWSKTESRLTYNGSYKDEETAALASDTLARKLMTNDQRKLKLNFPDDDSEAYAENIRKNKRKRRDAVGVSQNLEKLE